MNKKDFYKALTQGIKITSKIQGIENIDIHTIQNPDFDLYIGLPIEKRSTYGNRILLKICRNVLTIKFFKALGNGKYKEETKTIDYRYNYRSNMVILTEEEILKFLRKDFVTEI
ncbi:LamB/ Ycsf family protein [Lactococcus phage phiL47]|uniref:LamB/ Ycsf family protein n=1 Tax=Lactococcus phage phiL47 TaxID=1412875 RepID=V9VHW0_9CAUD|nr:LamB/ Ycsf family protein [Lactococcus phage phiL47]AHC94132.1 LamB/ Ycsf family protein [Lactococcus phage phiL47]